MDWTATARHAQPLPHLLRGRMLPLGFLLIIATIGGFRRAKEVDRALGDPKYNRSYRGSCPLDTADCVPTKSVITGSPSVHLSLARLWRRTCNYVLRSGHNESGTLTTAKPNEASNLYA